MSIKQDIIGLKFFKLSKNVIELKCDYCNNKAVGSYLDETGTDEGYGAIDVCEVHYKESVE